MPAVADIVILIADKNSLAGWRVALFPAWAAEWFKKTPSEIEGRDLNSAIGEIPVICDTIIAAIEDVQLNKTPVIDYCVEFTDANGLIRAVLMSVKIVKYDMISPDLKAAVRVPDVEGDVVCIKFRDATKPLAERKRRMSVGAFHGIIGESRAMLEVFHKIEVYSATDVPILITGETGTGKELVARALHERSGRRNNPFVAINCTALNEELFESELFGHEKGSFTGAVKTHKGRFERADKGSLFLDEIGDMPLRTQAKLLRVLETGAIERVGGESEQKVDVRIISATNILLEEAVALKRFRADLYHRLSVFRIHLPPLRERPEDIPLLIEHFLQLLNNRYNKNIARMTPDAVKYLQEYPWYGNIRELRNVIERVYVEAQTQIIGRNAFNEWERERDSFTAGQWGLSEAENRRYAEPIVVPAKQTPQFGSSDFLSSEILPQTSKRVEAENSETYKRRPEDYIPTLAKIPALSSLGTKTVVPGGTIDVDYTVRSKKIKKRIPLTADSVRDILRKSGGNATLAAKMLGMHKTTFYRKLKKLNLIKEEIANKIRRGEDE